MMDKPFNLTEILRNQNVFSQRRNGLIMDEFYSPIIRFGGIRQNFNDDNWIQQYVAMIVFKIFRFAGNGDVGNTSPSKNSLLNSAFRSRSRYVSRVVFCNLVNLACQEKAPAPPPAKHLPNVQTLPAFAQLGQRRIPTTGADLAGGSGRCRAKTGFWGCCVPGKGL